MGRLDHLVEAVYERFKDRYFKDESTSLSLVLSDTPNSQISRSPGRPFGYQVSCSTPTPLHLINKYTGTMHGWKKFTLQNIALTPERAMPTKTRLHHPRLPWKTTRPMSWVATSKFQPRMPSLKIILLSTSTGSTSLNWKKTRVTIRAKVLARVQIKMARWSAVSWKSNVG
jgi:hypothetical protein